ncbi:unnamed protein product [Chondrus crispus]|uniref:Uncharacterized protein n=1 Tax=Chondrus crispus TaxID=2769 RepID=R7QAV3_CHOCR|nr:unnamed protein product [Chondrus crispus]CDF34526.1 unnamed protein product [Chondrus crispus]|eukprot:XP_005714345.1 unnamed protein product [Chondrus crispus]
MLHEEPSSSPYQNVIICEKTPERDSASQLCKAFSNLL